MKWHTEYHCFQTKNKREFINITDLVSKAVEAAGIKEAMVLVSAMHITSGVFVLKSILFHHQILIPVTEGRLDLGPWQQIFYAEFDGQRRKRLLIIKVFGE